MKISTPYNGRSFLKHHGYLLVLVGLLMFFLSLIGRMAGVGMMGFLSSNQVAAIGLHEAYALISMLGVTLVFGAETPHLRRWHFLAASIHCFLLIFNLLHWSFYASLNMVVPGYAATLGHALLFVVEAWFGREISKSEIAHVSQKNF